MSRRVRDSGLQSREARRKLARRKKPYYAAIERELHIGYLAYRRGGGAWIARCYKGDRAYEIVKLGIAADATDADGTAVLDFWQAQAKARALMVARAQAGAGKLAPITVAEACADYADWVKAHRKDHGNTLARIDHFILPVLGKRTVESLTKKDVEAWHRKIAATPARVRSSTKPGRKQGYKPLATDEAKRRRKSTANRIKNTLVAALNKAFNDGAVADDKAWRRVRDFADVDRARQQYLTVAEAKRLANACEPDFRQLVQAALHTGCRYGELTRLRVRDFNPDANTLYIWQSKSGKPRDLHLSAEGVAFFTRLCTGRARGEFMLMNTGRSERAMVRERERLLKAGGNPDSATVADDFGWRSSEQARPMAQACKRANIIPAVPFHTLRHTWASLSVMNGMPLLVVSRNLGHADSRMVERHYGHLAPSYVAEQVRKGAPSFEFETDRKVVGLR